MTVIFTTSRADVARAKPCQVSRSKFLRCAQIRKELCYAFADVKISEENAASLLPEDGVPDVILREAVHMQEAAYFEPRMDGPANLRDPCAKDPEVLSVAVDAGAEETELADDEEASAVRMEEDARVSEGTVVSETLLGLDESHGDDPLGSLIVLQSRLRALQAEGDSLAERRSRLRAKGTPDPDDVVHVNAGIEQLRQHFVELKAIIRRMCPAGLDAVTVLDSAGTTMSPGPMPCADGSDTPLKSSGQAPCTVGLAEGLLRRDPENFHNRQRNEIDVRRSVRAALRQRASVSASSSGSASAVPTGGARGSVSSDGMDSSSAGIKALRVQAGQPLSLFESLSWVYSFVEFFYGDCLPRHPARSNPHSIYKVIGFQRLFQCLLLRDELEYSLPSDDVPYRARPMSRWDSPEFVMVFASTLRSLKLLASTRVGFLSGPSGSRFHKDAQIIADANVEDFERALARDRNQGAQTILQCFQTPRLSETNKPVFTALKQLLIHTATVPLTEGNKMKMRSTSYAVTLYFGALKVFLTTNFADTYSPITVLLYDGGRLLDAGEDCGNFVGAARINLFEDAPTMPTLQRMHQLVASYPTIQARLFLLMEQLTITELLGGLRASIGCEQLDSLDPWPRGTIYKCEDDYISDGSPGLANFMTCLLEPLEAQGRGFVHGHKKVTGVPRLSAANIKRIFTQGDAQVSSFMTQMRAAVLQAASTLQYESAVLPAKQMDVTVLPTTFSKHQQRVSRLDGGVEIDDETFRPLLEVTPVEPQGHVVRENTLAESQQRSSRNSYSRLPLTGCHQSLLPTYRSSASVGSLSEAALDEYGLTPSGVALPGVHANWDVDRSGRVSGILDDDGILYTNEMLQDDARKWMLAYARHVRSQFVQNHNHVCTKTCTKYADTERVKSGADACRHRAATCRFRFFHIVVLKVVEGACLCSCLFRMLSAFVCSTTCSDSLCRFSL